MFKNYLKKATCLSLVSILLFAPMPYIALAVDHNSEPQRTETDILENFSDISDAIRNWQEEYIIFASDVGLFQGRPVFIDIIGHWAQEYIIFANDVGLFQGTGNGIFSPNMAMTRAMFVTVIGRYANADVSEFVTSGFNDVVSDAFYAPYIEWAVELGIVAGTGNNMFEPTAPVTREQAAVILTNFINETSIESLKGTSSTSFFSDESQISSWAFDSINEIKNLGIINGRSDGSFDPQGVIIRAEASAMLSRIIQRLPELHTTKTNGL